MIQFSAPHPTPRRTARFRGESAARMIGTGPAAVPRRTATVLALMETGLHDYSTIAAAVGITVGEVKRIDMAEDPLVRRLGIEGIPEVEYFHLRTRVRCPRCSASIKIAPCVACSVHKATQDEAGKISESDHGP